MAANFNSVIERLTVPSTPRNVSVSVRHAARLLDVSESTVKRLIRDGRVRSHRIRGRR